MISFLLTIACSQQQIDQKSSLEPNTNTQSQITKTPLISTSSSWETHQNNTFGISFKHPKETPFNDGQENKDGWYTVTANYKNNGYNYFNFTVLDKKEGASNMKSLQYRAENIYAPTEVEFQNGKFMQFDGYGTSDYYFIDSYFEGEEYVYHFMMSRPEYSEDVLKLFNDILKTAELTK